MKKTILTLALAISSICTFAQEPTKLITYKNASGEWSPVEKKYMYGDYAYALITFSFYDTYISVDDKNRSLYRIIETLEKLIENNTQTVRCKAMDERNRDCLIYLTSYGDCSNSTITIFYPQSAYFYIIDK